MEVSKPAADEMYCAGCGSIIKRRAEICVKCGVRVAVTSQPAVLVMSSQTAAVPVAFSERSRLAAGILGVLLGTIGVHSFYLGNHGKGIIQIIVSIVTLGIGGLWGLIEGIIILAGGSWKDGEGRPLRKYSE